MDREIKSPPATVLGSKSFDGKHQIQFNEGSHRYKWVCPCHVKETSVGVTTFLKGGYPTSMGLISWFKAQTAEAVFQALTVPGEDGFYPRDSFYPIGNETKKEIIKTAKMADRAVSQEAADVGTVVHEYCYLNDTTGVPNELMQTIATLEARDLIMAGINKYKAWSDQNKDKLVAAEGLIASPTNLFCGKFDRLATRKGKLILGDYKTSKSIYLDQFIQLGAYSIAVREWLGLQVQGLEVLRFGKDDGAFETMLIDDPNEIKAFEAQALRCRATHEFRKLENDPRWKWEG